jgi:hypothetical protein
VNPPPPDRSKGVGDDDGNPEPGVEIDKEIKLWKKHQRLLHEKNRY